MPDADHDRGDSHGADRARHEVPAAFAGGEVIGDEERDERQAGAPDVEARVGRIEAERPGRRSGPVVVAQQRRTASVESAPKPERKRNRLDERERRGRPEGPGPPSPMRRVRPCIPRPHEEGDEPDQAGHEEGHRRARWTPPARSGAAATTPRQQAVPARVTRSARGDRRRRPERRPLPASRASAPACGGGRPRQKTRSSTTRTSPGRTITFGERPSLMSATG